MTTQVFLERTFDPPLSVNDVYGIARECAWCYDLHNVSWQGSFLSTDGRTLLCWFASPDAESARLAIRQSGARVRRLWPGTVHYAPEPAVPNVAVERSFAEPVTFESVAGKEERAAGCLRTHNVKPARSFFSTDSKRMICFYEAPDAESVRVAQREAGMPVDVVWAFSRLGPDTMPKSPG
jgi:hypothetical protein